MNNQDGYTDADYLRLAGELLRRVKERSYAAMELRPGLSALDMGCGPGSDTLAMAQLVGDTGRVVGVDFDPAMVSEADRRAEQAGVAARVTHRQADATALPFADGSFDCCRSERVFQHLCDAEKALSEMIRVTAPGGRVVVLDSDWGSASTNSTHVDVERRLARFRAERYLANGYSGRHLAAMFRRSGLVDIVVEPYSGHTASYAVAQQIGFCDVVEARALADGVVSEDELNEYRHGLVKLDRERSFFASLGGVIAVGRKAN